MRTAAATLPAAGPAPAGREPERVCAEIEGLATAGELRRALALADRLAAALPPGPDRARALLLRARLDEDDLDLGEALIRRALDDAADEPRLRARALGQLGRALGVLGRDIAQGVACLQEALAIAERAGDATLRPSLAASLAHLQALAGRPDCAALAAAVRDEAVRGEPPRWPGARTLEAEQRLWSGDLAGARAELAAVHEDLLRAGAAARLPYSLFDRALVECAAGDLARGAALARAGLEAARDGQDRRGERLLLHAVSLAAAWRGDVDAARTHARTALAGAAARQERPGVVRAHGVLGLLALSEGDGAEAALHLRTAAELTEAMGVGHPGAHRVLPDAIEALAGAGDVLTADALLERLTVQAAAVGSPWAAAAAERARGVVALARGDAGAAAGHLRAAAAALAWLGHHPDAARAQLALGRALARAGRRAEAADALAAARDRFAAIGAPLWERQAAAGLERATPDRGR